MIFYKENDVFSEALERVRFVFDNCDDVMVAMSGGKDSTVVFNIALMVAREKGRLPLKVFWLDQEAEWQHTVDYMDHVMRLDEVEPRWYQIPFDFTNSLSPDKNMIRLWDEGKEKLWIHPKSDISIKEAETRSKRFHQIYKELQNQSTDAALCGVLCGLRVEESPARRLTITGMASQFKGITWTNKQYGNCIQFYPIYDFTFSDIWTAIARNGWEYNRVYDLQYRYGVNERDMRVSALIHETAWGSIKMLQEFEPATYNKFVRRVSGTSTFNHAFDEGGIIPTELPFAFRDWMEYRDYLLEHITKDEYKELFRKRWRGQDGDDWYKLHVKEVIINDIDGTINGNKRKQIAYAKKASEYKGSDVDEITGRGTE